MSSLALLTGPDAAALVRRALVLLGAGEVATVEVRRVHHRPGVDTTVSFAAATPGRAERVVLLTDAEVTGPGVVALASAGHRLTAWLHPHDPRLPALADALDPAALRAWLRPAAVVGGVGAELLSYRPLRRAVVRATAGRRSFFVKLWRPERAPDLVRRHRLLDAAGVGPRIVAEPAPGVLVVADADGVPLASRLADWNATGAPLPDPVEVLRLLDRLPAALLEFPRRPSWSDRADFHGQAAAAALPDQAEGIARVVAPLQAVLRGRPEAPVVPTHGDFYEANVFCAGPAFTSLIDVDTAGPGRRVDDLACLLGHLAVLPDLSPGHYSRLPEVTHAWAAVFERHVDAVELRARVAGVILSLVAGAPRARGLARLDACRAWLYRAQNP